MEESGPVEIPVAIWRDSLQRLQQQQQASKKKQKKKAPPRQGLFWLRHFTYSLHDRTFVKYNVETSSNLFFQFATTLENVSKDYFIVQMDDADEEQEDSNHGNGKRSFFSYDVDPLRERILQNGILAGQRNNNHDDNNNDEENQSGVAEEETLASRAMELYHLIGCSNSQVQRHCYIFRRSHCIQENESFLLQILPDLRELELKKGTAKRVKYAGLLFSGITPVAIPKDTIVEEIPSVKNGKYDFTDGPGLISKKLALRIKEQLNLPGENGDCPSVFQIRYCGTISLLDNGREGKVCKGVLLVDPNNTTSHKISLRQSMLKVSSSRQACDVLSNTLGICDYSRAYSQGRLGQQQICLLSEIVDKHDFLKLQREHLDCAQKSLVDPIAMAWMLCMDRRKDKWTKFQSLLLLDKATNGNADETKVPQQYSQCASALGTPQTALNKKKVQLPLAASRNLFGAVFPEQLGDYLKEGECIVLLEDGPLFSEEEMYVIVSRSPSYYPGDIRVLRVKKLPSGHPVLQLRNVILFSTKGSRPDADKMGGGDLDGDKYLVVWHPILMKYASKIRRLPAATYDEGSTSTTCSQHCPPSNSAWIHYVAMTDNSMLGEVETTFYKLAKQFGINSHQIHELNQLFSSLVDRVPTSLEAFRKLKNSVAGGRSSRPCVWEVMAAAQNQQTKPAPLTRIQTYQAFQLEVDKLLTHPYVFRRRTTEDFGYHFLHSFQKTQLQSTIQAVESKSLALPSASGGVLSGNNLEDSLGERPSADAFVIASAENKALSEFERRVSALFLGPLAKLKAEKTEPTRTFKLHEARKELASKRKDEQIELLERKSKDLETERSEAEGSFQIWLVGQRGRVDKLKQQLENSYRPRIDKCNRDLRACRKELDVLRSHLKEADDELALLWFWMLSAKQQTIKRKRELETRIAKENAELHSLSSDLSHCERDLRSQLQMLESQADKEKHDKDKLHREKLCEMDAKRNRLSEEIERCEKVFLDEMSGAAKKNLEDRAADIRLELSDLRWGLSSSEDNTTLSKGELLNRKASVLENTASSLFCPTLFNKAGEALSDLREREESVQLGREHILHKLEQAKRNWQRRLESNLVGYKERREEWKAVMENLERVLTIEENRLMGVPRGGKRQGPMPVYFKRSLLRKHMCTSQALIITAGTGCGKSTQIPQLIADDFYLHQSLQCTALEEDVPIRICCTQPRRMAAQKLARRVAEEYKTTLGDLVGFKVGTRGRSREDCVQVSEKTVIEFVTEGLLLFNLAKSPAFVEQYDCIIIDEMHERNTEQDLCLCLLREYLRKAKSSRPSFKVVVMSASINAPRFCAYFDDCPTMDCPGRNFAVEDIYVPVDDAVGGASDTVLHAVDVLFEHIVDGAKGTPGDVLIFLSGAKEIEECVSSIWKRASKTADLVVAYPLFSRLDQDSISKATDPDHRNGLYNEMSSLKGQDSSKGRAGQIRKVICSTDVAETSLTIDRVRFVIDSGRAKRVRYNHTLRCSVLSEGWISHASTIQRKGRAGRTDCGWCYHLYSLDFHEQEMKEYDTPKILEQSVDELILLSLHICQQSVEYMGLLDSPSEDDVESAKQRLLDLTFVQEERGCISLTEDGKLASGLSSIRPESIRMVLNACKEYPKHIKRVINLAVLMSSDETIFDQYAKVDEEETTSHIYGDHLRSLKHLEWFEQTSKRVKKGGMKSLKKKCGERGIDFRVLQGIQEDAEKCYQELKKQKKVPATATPEAFADGEDECLLRALISGYFHRISECPEPEFVNGSGSRLLDPQVALRLDRNSCLHKSLSKMTKELAFMEDEENQMAGSEISDMDGPESDLHAVREDAVQPSFLLHGRLFCLRDVTSVFIMDASVVEGHWIEEEAPPRWLSRVSFDAHRKNLCRVTVKYVGASILSELVKSGFFKKVQETTHVSALVASLDRNLVRITGTQSAVESAKSAVQRELASVMHRRKKKDQVFNKSTDLRYTCGMTVEDALNSSRQLHEVFCSFGRDEFHRISNVLSISVDMSKRVLHVNRACERSRKALKECIDVGPAWRLETRKYEAVLEFTPPHSQSALPYDFKTATKTIIKEIEDSPALQCSNVHVKSFSGERASSTAMAVSREACRASGFWRSLCAQGSYRYCNFVPSQEEFAFGLDGSASAKVFKDTILKLSKAANTFEVLQTTPFARYQIRRFAAVLAEVRKRCPSVLFHLVEVRESGEDKTCAKFEFIGTDYSWLMSVAKRKDIGSIVLSFSAIKAKDAADARKTMNKELSIEALTHGDQVDDGTALNTNGGKSEWKQCVMCRRDIRIEKGNKNEPNNGTKGVLDGWNLTLCGCSYCRECFRNGVTETLTDDTVRSAKCFLCKRIVLGKDCFNIIAGPYLRQAKESKDVFTEEWNKLCRLGDANYCKNNQTLLTQAAYPGSGRRRKRRMSSSDNPQGWATCPDCDYSMVFPGGYKYFICRNPNCRSKMCTGCRTVVAADEGCECEGL